MCTFLGKRPCFRVRGRLQPDKEGREGLSGRPKEPSVASDLNYTAAFEEDQQNQSPTDIVNSAIDLSVSFLVAPDVTQWTRIVPGTYSRGRYSQQNILRECPGAISYARRNVRVNCPASAWRLIIDKFILEHIKSCIVTEAHLQTRCKDFTFSVEELETFIGIMYAGGVTGKNDIPLTDFWSKN